MYLKLQGLQDKLRKTDQLYSVVQSDTSLLNVRSYSKWKGAAHSCCMDTVSHTTLFQGHIIFGDKLRKKYNQVISHSHQLVYHKGSLPVSGTRIVLSCSLSINQQRLQSQH